MHHNPTGLQNDALLSVLRTPESVPERSVSLYLPDADERQIPLTGTGSAHGFHPHHGRKEPGYLHRLCTLCPLPQTDGQSHVPVWYSYSK